MTLSDAEQRRLAGWRTEPGLVLLEGFHAIKHALRFGAEIAVVAAVDTGAVEALAARLAPDLRGRFGELVRATDEWTIEAAAGRVHHTGVVALARRPPARTLLDDALAASGHVVLLEDPRDLGNLGAVVRVAAAADAGGVLTTGSSDPWDPAALRGAAGLHFALPVARIDGIGELQRPIVALDPDAPVLEPGVVPPDAVLAFGTERDGLSDELLAAAHGAMRLPMRAGVSSLNLATAVAAVLFLLRQAER